MLETVEEEESLTASFESVTLATVAADAWTVDDSGIPIGSTVELSCNKGHGRDEPSGREALMEDDGSNPDNATLS